MSDYDFEYEAQRVIDAIDPRAGATMTVVCALREAFQAGQASHQLLPGETRSGLWFTTHPSVRDAFEEGWRRGAEQGSQSTLQTRKAAITYEQTEHRYRNDASFHALVTTIRHAIDIGDFTIGELTEAVALAKRITTDRADLTPVPLDPS